MNLRSYNLLVLRTAPAHLLDWTINKAHFPLRRANTFFFFELDQCMVSFFRRKSINAQHDRTNMRHKSPTYLASTCAWEK